MLFMEYGADFPLCNHIIVLNIEFSARFIQMSIYKFMWQVNSWNAENSVENVTPNCIWSSIGDVGWSCWNVIHHHCLLLADK